MKKFYLIKSFYKVKETWEKAKQEGCIGLAIQLETSFKKSITQKGKFYSVFSTNDVDRHGEIVEQNWKLKNYKKNPVYLDSHNYESIERIIGRVDKLKVKDNQLQGEIIFALENPLGRLAYDLAEGGFLRASSVGFIPLKFDDDKQIILEAELLEISAVVVGANSEALLKKYEEQRKNELKKITEISLSDIKSKRENKRDDVKPAEKKIKEALIKKIEARERALTKIIEAIKLTTEATKGRVNDNSAVNNKINIAIKNLLKLKKI